ncbi:hypothetical protein [Chryseobacterium oranimense]|uniref:hypothetical protein n=1 Tax=Chryseobacterium oranimense TaxID=421058 RepID=UPI0022355657|nr:hypothetical protein [Chryseobacterium oranimense]
MLAIVMQVIKKVAFIISFSFLGPFPEQSASIRAAVKRQQNIPREFRKESKIFVFIIDGICVP